jgi:hypothetical protein
MASRVVIAPVDPRGLARDDAAAYCGLTPEGFDEWVKCGAVPGPIPSTQRRDRKANDLAFDRASGIATMKTSAFDDWQARHAR